MPPAVRALIWNTWPALSPASRALVTDALLGGVRPPRVRGHGAPELVLDEAVEVARLLCRVSVLHGSSCVTPAAVKHVVLPWLETWRSWVHHGDLVLLWLVRDGWNGPLRGRGMPYTLLDPSDYIRRLKEVGLVDRCLATHLLFQLQSYGREYVHEFLDHGGARLVTVDGQAMLERDERGLADLRPWLAGGNQARCDDWLWIVRAIRAQPLMGHVPAVGRPVSQRRTLAEERDDSLDVDCRRWLDDLILCERVPAPEETGAEQTHLPANTSPL